MAPEVLSRSNVDAGPLIDIWALGVMLYVMVIGELPFDGQTEDEIIESILKKKLKFKNTKPISNELKDLLSKILTKDPDKRISMFEMQNHPWMEMADDELEQSIENSKLEEEEEKKKEDELDDLAYLSKLKLEEKSPSVSLDPKDASSSSSKHSKKGGASPRGASPRFSKSSGLNGSIKSKPKPKVDKKKKSLK